MNKTKVIAVNQYGLTFDCGLSLSSEHQQDCCESHELTFQDLSLGDFDGLEFDLSGDDFFKRVDGYGIELIPLVGFPVRIAGNGYNNGYYGTNLTLVLDGNGTHKTWDITECQDIKD